MVDGKVDTEASDRLMAHAGVGRFDDRRTEPAERASTVNPPVVGDVLAKKLRDAAGDEDELAPALIAFAEHLATGHHVDLITAQTIKENALALIRLIEARKRAGEVIEIADAEAILFEMFRLQRDAWLNFPSRVGPLMAADLGVAPERVVEVLTQHVHQHLADLGEPENTLRQTGEVEVDGAEGLDAAA